MSVRRTGSEAPKGAEHVSRAQYAGWSPERRRRASVVGRSGARKTAQTRSRSSRWPRWRASARPSRIDGSSGGAEWAPS
eukprot:14577850-Alexandrium_andersonii.AAC.1